MPSLTLLPTPEPEKIPIRWPRPQGSSASLARIPLASELSLVGRSSAGRVGSSMRPGRGLAARFVAINELPGASAESQPYIDDIRDDLHQSPSASFRSS